MMGVVHTHHMKLVVSVAPLASAVRAMMNDQCTRYLSKENLQQQHAQRCRHCYIVQPLLAPMTRIFGCDPGQTPLLQALHTTLNNQNLVAPVMFLLLLQLS
jgi:hypothetical protein